MKKIILVSLLLVSAYSMSACTAVGMATGAGATLGVAAASEGGIRGTAKDFQIQAQINELWFSHDLEMFRKLDLTVNHARVLITGVVQNPEHRVEAVRLAWQPNGVKQVINEIRVAESEGIIGFAKDAWIASRLRVALTLNKEVNSINYNIDVVQGTVYLMGVAQNQAELNEALSAARVISGVKGVVSYVKLVAELAEEAASEDNLETMAPPAPDTYNDTPYEIPPSADEQTVAPPPPGGEASGGPVQITPVETEPLTSEDILWDAPRDGASQ